MSDGFVTLEALLRSRAILRPETHSVLQEPAVEPPRAADAHVVEDADARASACGDVGEIDSLVQDLALARLAALEAFERCVPRLLQRLAHDVLARELATAPGDLAALVRALLAEHARDEPVALIVAPGDAARVAGGLPVRVDTSLRPGDVALEVRDGDVDARFVVRLAAAVSGSLE